MVILAVIFAIFFCGIKKNWQFIFFSEIYIY